MLALWIALAWAEEPVVPPSDPAVPGATDPLPVDSVVPETPAEGVVPEAPAEAVTEATGAPADTDDPGSEEGSEEIVVYGDRLVEQARKELISALKAEGYDEVIDKGDYLLLRSDAAYKGEIRIYDDGWVKMKRQPVRFASRDLPWAKKGTPLSWASCILAPPMCLRTSGQLLGRRKWLGVQERTMESIKDEVTVLGDRVADVNTQQTINELPAKLTALWTNGDPLEATDRRAKDMQDRKEAILDYWDSRTDTVWGDRVREAVESFIRSEVQTSDTPFTPEEIAALNKRRSCTRELVLER